MISRIAIGLFSILAVLRADDSASEPKLINLNVIAVDNHGQPVNDLSSDDFEVSDAGSGRKLPSFVTTKAIAAGPIAGIE